MSLLARRAALAGISARKMREEKEQLTSRAREYRDAEQQQIAQKSRAAKEDRQSRMLRIQLSRSKKYAQAIHVRNQNNLVRRPQRRPKLKHQIRPPLTTKCTMEGRDARPEDLGDGEGGRSRRPPRRLVEKEWQLLNAYNTHVHALTKDGEQKKKTEMQRLQAQKLDSQLSEKDARKNSRRRDQEAFAKALFDDMKEFQREEAEKERRKREKVEKIKRERSEQLRLRNERAERLRNRKYEAEQREIKAVRIKLEQEKKEQLEKKLANLEQQRKLIEVNKRWLAEKKAKEREMLEKEKVLAREYQEKLEREQKSREMQLKKIYSVQEKNLNLALFFNADVEKKEKAEEEMRKRFEEENDRKLEADAKARAARVRRMKAQLRANLNSQLREKRRAAEEEIVAEREYAKQAFQAMQKEIKREEHKQKKVWEKSRAYRQELEEQIKHHRIRKQQIAMPKQQYNIHKELIQKALEWRGQKDRAK